MHADENLTVPINHTHLHKYTCKVQPNKDYIIVFHLTSLDRVHMYIYISAVKQLITINRIQNKFLFT